MNVAMKKTVIENAVVGIVDMVSSTKLSNSVDVLTEWEIKERFLKAAHTRAEQTGMTILTLTGDGFLFLANPNGGIGWASGLRDFQTLLVADYRAILREFASQIGAVTSGIRFGIAAGPVIIGRMAGRQEAMAVGSAINLAARLCASADVDQMAMSSAVWEVYGALVRDIDFAMYAHPELKGFDHVIVGFHVSAQTENVVALAPKRDAQVPLSHRWSGAGAQRAA